MAKRNHTMEIFLPQHSHERGVQAAPTLTIDELEAGLRLLNQADTDPKDFWVAYEPAFRETIRLAIRETSAALLRPQMSPLLRAELEGQLEWLRTCLDPNPRSLN
jgi:hypothetical protein